MEVRKRIGVVFQEPALDTKLTAKENLEFHAMLYGMKRKLEIARAFVHEPEVLFLDEPTLGIDM